MSRFNHEERLRAMYDRIGEREVSRDRKGCAWIVFLFLCMLAMIGLVVFLAS